MKDRSSFFLSTALTLLEIIMTLRRVIKPLLSTFVMSRGKARSWQEIVIANLFSFTFLLFFSICEIKKYYAGIKTRSESFEDLLKKEKL